MTESPRGSAIEMLWHKWRIQALLVVGLRERALEALDGLLARWPGHRYLLSSRANLRAQTGDARGAIADLRALVTASPDDAHGWFNLGFVLEQQGELAEAEAAFTRSTVLSEKLDRAWYGLGLVLIRQQRHRDALVALKRNTELQPMSPYGWYQMARVHMDLNEPEEARKILRHLEGFEPKVAAQLKRETGLEGATPS
ncbi:MAG TPA: tetratricopeptide repeat protein [Methylibium sp.]|nr:tetratricopeptide repeat protein [Methylibium sp.]